MTKYPRDEFDDIPEASERQGVHRSPAGSRSLALRPILVAGALALVIGLVSFFFLPRTAEPTAEGTPAPSAAATAAPSSPAPSAPATTTPPAPKPPAPPVVDKSTAVSVYNATDRAGLAGLVGNKAQAAGWTLGTVANWAGAPVEASVVYYNSEALKGTAEQLAKDAGIATATLAAGGEEPLVVVAGPGYP